MALIGIEKINPRHLREKFTGWDGKRVVVGTTTFHYLCGIWKRMDGDKVVFQIGTHEMPIPITQIDTIGDANPAQSDFFK